MHPDTSRRGVLLIFVLLVIMVLSIFAFQFRFTASQAQWDTYRFDLQESARQLAEAAANEAFMIIDREAIKDDSAIFKSLSVKGNKPDGKTFPVSLPNLEKHMDEMMVRPGIEPQISAEMRVVSCRSTDDEGHPYFDGGEGVGTLEIQTTATLKNKQNPSRMPISIHFVRHHDFKVAALVTPRDNLLSRNRYANNAMLDYLLCIRNGVNEFWNSKAAILNSSSPLFKPHGFLNPWTKAPLNPSQRGKIFLGDKSAVGKDYVFLNVTDETREILLPAENPLAFRIIYLDDCKKLFPTLKDPDYEGNVDQVEGWFWANNMPISGNYLLPAIGFTTQEVADFQNRCRNVVINKLNAQLSKADDENARSFFETQLCFEPGIPLVECDSSGKFSAEAAKSLLEGDIRQRFFYMCRFNLSGDKLSADIRQKFDEEVKHHTKAHLPVIEMENPSDAGKQEPFYSNFPEINKKSIDAGDYSYSSCFDDWYPYLPGLTAVKPPGRSVRPEGLLVPRFFAPNATKLDTILDYSPYAMDTLYNGYFFYESGKDISTLPGLGEATPEGSVITLRGMTNLVGNGPAIIGKSGQTVSIRGQGMLYSADGFIIKAKLLKEHPEFFAILYTNREIRIESNEVEAGLVALSPNLNSRIIPPNAPLTIRGSLTVDMLGSAHWASDTTLDLWYDPVFKSPTSSKLSITIQRRVVFQKMWGGEA
ncbi:MAG: hypothetical protein WA705_28280 [Candidatus Ozemobacteraceae bacterium]